MNLKSLNLKNRTVLISDHENSKEYAIFVPIIEVEGTSCIVFEVRAEGLTRQPNEICLPGGRIEKGESKAHAAKRETAEELAIPPELISIDFELDTLVTPFNTILYPFAGTIDHYQGSFNQDEVKEIFLVPVDFFIQSNPQIHPIDVIMQSGEDFPYEMIQHGKDYPWAKGRYPVYFYTYQGRIIWGITARIVYNFVQLILQSP